jgi:hypothetical protein
VSKRAGTTSTAHPMLSLKECSSVGNVAPPDPLEIGHAVTIELPGNYLGFLAEGDKLSRIKTFRLEAFSLPT